MRRRPAAHKFRNLRWRSNFDIYVGRTTHRTFLHQWYWPGSGVNWRTGRPWTAQEYKEAVYGTADQRV